MKVLKVLYRSKASIADPDGFKDKVKLFEKTSALKGGDGLKRSKSTVSALSKS